MKTSSVATLIILGLLFTCSQTPVVKPDIPQTEQECLARGGNWTHIGLPGMPKRCDLKATDGGKKCTDSSQCEGECMAPEAAQEGDTIEGSCSEYILVFGCKRFVEDGRVGMTICAD